MMMVTQKKGSPLDVTIFISLKKVNKSLCNYIYIYMHYEDLYSDDDTTHH